MASGETKTDIDGWFGRAALAEAAAAPNPAFNQDQVGAAEGSVRALIADLRYIMGKEQASRWPVLASAALQHHTPPVPAEQLAEDYRALQRFGRLALTGICQGAFDDIRDAVLAIRATEARLQA